MSDTGFKVCGTQTNTAAGHTGTNPTISNLGNVVSSNDVYATIVHGSGTNTSDYIHFTNFDFSAIGAGDTINGVEINIERKSGTTNRIGDEIVQLVVGGSHTGDSKPAAARWSTTEGVTPYGGAADLWGLGLTVAQVRASTFGFALKTTNNAQGAVTGSIDYVEMKVYYTVGSSTAGFNHYYSRFIGKIDGEGGSVS